MPFIPHTQSDIDAMLQAIGETSTAALFDEIPDDMRFKGELNLPDSLSEMALMRLMQQRARRDEVALNFVGAGAYEHHICLLYTSPSPRDRTRSRMPSSA